MSKKINRICSNPCGLLCMVISIITDITEDTQWVIAAAIYKVAASVLEGEL